MAYAQTGSLGFGGFVWSGLEVKLVGQGKSVKFKKSFTGFSFGGGACQLAGKWNINPKDLPHFYPSTGCEIEVIGNIYENPKLLKETK